MANKLGYFFWGLSMLIHAIYMLKTHEVSFGWDKFLFNDFRLYAIVVPYMLFALWIMYYGVLRNKKN